MTLNKIKTDDAIQSRVKISADVVKDYAEAMAAGAEFEPVVVFRDKTGNHWLADGYHRYRAAQKAKIKSLTVVVHKGEFREAVLYSLGANTIHGLRRTNEDKRNAVTAMLKDEQWRSWTDGRIATHCGVSREFVSGIRDDLSSNGCQMPTVRKAVRNGKEYDVDTAKADLATMQYLANRNAHSSGDNISTSSLHGAGASRSAIDGGQEAGVGVRIKSPRIDTGAPIPCPTCNPSGTSATGGWLPGKAA